MKTNKLKNFLEKFYQNKDFRKSLSKNKSDFKRGGIAKREKTHCFNFGIIKYQ